MDRLKPSRPITAVSAVVLDNNRVLLVRRKANPNLNLWALPGGAIRAGERASDAATREVLEETGIIIETGTLIDFIEIIQPEGSTEPDYHYVVLCFQARMVGGTIAADSDAAEAAWIGIEDAHSLNLTAGTRTILEKIAAEPGNPA